MEKKIGEALFRLGQAASTYFWSGRFKEAFRLLFLADQIASMPEVPAQDRLNSFLRKAHIGAYYGSFITNDYSIALDGLEDARQAAREVKDDLLQASFQDIQGLIYYHISLTTGKDNFDLAAAYFERAFAIRQAALGDQAVLCESLLHLGLAAKRRAHYRQADEKFQMAYEIAQRLDLWREMATASYHIGVNHLRTGKYPQALAYFRASLALLDKSGFRIALPFVYLSIGKAFLGMENPAEAYQQFELAERQAIELQVRRAAALAAYNLAEWHSAQKEDRQARCFYQLANQRAEGIWFKPVIIASREKLQISSERGKDLNGNRTGL